MKSRTLLFSAYVIISTIVVLNPSIGKADINVYDNNNQYLGILLELTDDYLAVFIPSLGASWSIEYDFNFPCMQPVWFDSANCSGTPYIRTPLPEIVDLSNSAKGKFYKSDYAGKRTFIPGYSYDLLCQCQVGAGDSAEYFPLTQVTMPFTTPIELPINFKIKTKSVVIPLF